jgi:hypothetical protein
MKIFLKSIGTFLAVEASLFIAQAFIFFLVATFSSHFLASEELLRKFSDSKLSDSTSAEFWFTLLGVIVILGFLSLLSGFARLSAVGRISSEVLLEVPRTFYLFGSTITGTGLAWVVYDTFHSDLPTVLTDLKATMLFAGGSLFFGAGLKFGLMRSQHGNQGSRP